MEKKELSICIPVYNAEKYLSECLDSILQQDLDKNLYEIICVDDGSTDASAEILDRYAKNYDNIKVFHKENGGVSSARNEAIERTSGKWIWFIDSDDFIVQDCMSWLLENANKHDAEMVLFSSRRVEKFQKYSLDKSAVNIIAAEGRNNVLSLTPQKTYVNGSVFFFFLAEKINKVGLKFDCTMKYVEDTKFILQYKMLLEKALLIDAPIYCYRKNPSSAMNNLNGQAHAYSMMRLAELYDSLIKEEGNEQRFLVARCRAVRNMLFDYCFYIRDYKMTKGTLNMVKEKGWYPYKVRLKIKSKSFKGILINILNSLMEIKWIYLLICKIYSKKQNRQ